MSFLITGPGIYKTRDGREARVYYEVPRNMSYCFFGILNEVDQEWMREGRWNLNEQESEHDLIERIGDLPCTCGMREAIDSLKADTKKVPEPLSMKPPFKLDWPSTTQIDFSRVDRRFEAATAAMQGICSAWESSVADNARVSFTARDAVRCADALLAELDKKAE